MSILLNSINGGTGGQDGSFEASASREPMIGLIKGEHPEPRADEGYDLRPGIWDKSTRYVDTFAIVSNEY